MKLLDKILRAGEGRRLKAAQALVEPINSLGSEIEKLSDAELQAKTGEFRQRVANGESLDDILIEAFAVTREAAWRVIGQRHYDVQLVGGIAMHWGSVAEMKTGEGKTLVSTLPAYLNAISGKGVHLVTVNDYLASRDAEWMGMVHRWLGLTVGLVVPGSHNPEHKRAQYAADITYGTNNEFGFDYLRDNMARNLEAMTQRGHNFAIVDEIDSILIDEARTPLIISGKVKGAADLYYRFSDVVRDLRRDEHYEVDEEKRVVAITDDGISRVEEILEVENLYDGVQADLVHQLGVALRAKELFHRDKDYLVVDGEVKIVDEFTGRVLDGRRWSDGLHQAVEAKEAVKIKEEQQTMATVTLQNYFRLYNKLAGMTGTALADATELETTYGLEVVQVPTNKPIQRADQPDFVYKSENGKFAAVVADLEERVANGQPVLVGTASVEKSEKLAKLLADRGIEHEILNAKAHFREADVVAQAGAPSAVTVATNMAGRGVDIILGGNPEKLADRDTAAAGYDLETEEGQAYYDERLAYWGPICAEDAQKVLKAGGLYVLGTERHESRRIDNQLRGRAGRQGDPGESRFYLSLEDELMRVFASGAASRIMDRAMSDDLPIESSWVSKSVERAQTSVEQRNAEIRKNVLKYDEVYDQQRKVIYERRRRILDGGDLRNDSLEAIEVVGEMLVQTYCLQELDDTWDLEGLHTELKNYWSTELELADLQKIEKLPELQEAIRVDGVAEYERREGRIGDEIVRQSERQIMLQLVDQRWRDHLTEMSQLREGINLRAMGQRDPLTEWQREGYDLFAAMIAGIDVDYVRYVMNFEIATVDPKEDESSEGAGGAKSDRPTNGQQASGSGSSADKDTKGSSKPGVQKRAQRAKKPVVAPVVQASDLKATQGPAPEAKSGKSTEASGPVINDEWEKTGRNEPCPCGSGKKYKHCHG